MPLHTCPLNGKRKNLHHYTKHRKHKQLLSNVRANQLF